MSEINNDIIPPVSQQKVYSILRVAAPILPIRSNQNSSGSSSSSSSTSSSCGIEKKETITKASNIFNLANSEGTLANTNSSTKTKFVFILNAFVNGFAQLKICADKIDYEYIIEIYWSNEDRSFVKRTFDDFVIFHRNLLQSFSQFFSEISTNQNHSNNSIINNRNSNRNSRLFFNNFEEYLMPILPASKKPFWVSHLKLAESREIELNSYVQRILKLPTQISHSELVLKFFESQTSDPKPTRYGMNSNISQDHRFYDDLEEEEASNQNNNTVMNTLSTSASESPHRKNANESDNESNSNYEDEDDDEENEDYDDDNISQNFPSFLDINNSTNNNQQVMNGNLRKKKMNREAGLWWDEDEALNELTSSMSFDFNNHLNQNNLKKDDDFDEEEEENNNEEHDTDEEEYNVRDCLYYDETQNEGSKDSIALKTLEKILNKSDLFSNAST